VERFEGKRCLITGGGSGMGQATVLRLLREAGTVVAVDVSGKGLADTADRAEVEGTAGRLTTTEVDVASEPGVAEMVAEAAGTLGGLDVLINAAGILRSAHTHECTLDLWEQVIAVNLTGTFLVTRAALPHLLDGGGVIVNFASTSAFHAHPYMAAYSASKAGVAAFTQTIALEYCKRNVRAVCVAPGGVATPLVLEITLPEDADPSFFRRLMPNGRGFAEPHEVAGMVAALASDDGSFVNGTTLLIDGATHA
jgi:NAD(P)-dependent dehydrogenase (short-subunit alcohol dehydrogenase family)